MFTNAELTEVGRSLGEALPAGRAEVAEGNVQASATADGRRLPQPDGGGALWRRRTLSCRSSFGGATLLTVGFSQWYIALLGAALGYMAPSFWLGRQTTLRQKQIRNGLPDALDLMIVCIEAGSGIDQSLVKTSDELDISYPALAEELRLITTEMRAGKPRLEAFKNFASRTKVDEVRSLVAMLDPDGSVRHQHRAGAAHPRGSRRAPSGGRMPRSGPQRSASSSCSRSCSVCFLRST